MRTLGVLTLVVAMTAVTAQALINTTELGLTLTVLEDGSATITNNQGAAVNVDAYEVWSAGANLNPTTWESIADQAASDPIGVLGALGAGALSFGELTATASLLAEASLSSAAVMQPAAPFAIGTPVGAVVDAAGTYTTLGAADISFFYTKPSTPGDKYLGVVEIIPEPATMGLLVIGGIALVARRRRR